MLLVGAVLLAIFVLDAPWDAVVIGVAALVELAETGFWIWLSKRRRVRVGAEAMIGEHAEVVAACRPDGLVRIGGELWQARCRDGAEPGQRVRVLRLEGLVLIVEPGD